MNIISRKEAKEQGLKRYYTGVLCPKGHDAMKLVSNYTCVKCTKEKALLWEKNNQEKTQNYKNSWVTKNKDKVLSNTRKYQANKKQRLPRWVDEEELWLLKEAYTLCKFRTEVTGIKHHVDHIVPLQGKNVSGLHTINNIQIIPKKQNRLKSNYWDWDTQQ